MIVLPPRALVHDAMMGEQEPAADSLPQYAAGPRLVTPAGLRVASREAGRRSYGRDRPTPRLLRRPTTRCYAPTATGSHPSVRRGRFKALSPLIPSARRTRIKRCTPTVHARNNRARRVRSHHVPRPRDADAPPRLFCRSPLRPCLAPAITSAHHVAVRDTQAVRVAPWDLGARVPRLASRTRVGAGDVVRLLSLAHDYMSAHVVWLPAPVSPASSNIGPTTVFVSQSQAVGNSYYNVVDKNRLKVAKQ